MHVNDQLAKWAKGHVRGQFVNLSTGETQGAFETDNVITYRAADLMARMLGGDSEWVPQYMGYIYGALASPSPMPDPDSPADRDQTWSDLSTQLADVGVTGNILIASLSGAPSYAVDGDSTLYNGNQVTLISNSGSLLEYGFATSAPYATALVTGNYFYHAMLLSRVGSGSSTQYYPFSRVSLDISGSFPQKPAGWELALFWDISYF